MGESDRGRRGRRQRVVRAWRTALAKLRTGESGEKGNESGVLVAVNEDGEKRARDTVDELREGCSTCEEARSHVGLRLVLGRLAHGRLLGLALQAHLRSCEHTDGGQLNEVQRLTLAGRSSGWIMGRTPPCEMRTLPRSLLSSSSLRIASSVRRARVASAGARIAGGREEGRTKVARDDASLLVVASSVASELKDLGGEILEHSSKIDCAHQRVSD